MGLDMRVIPTNEVRYVKETIGDLTDTRRIPKINYFKFVDNTFYIWYKGKWKNNNWHLEGFIWSDSIDDRWGWVDEFITEKDLFIEVL